MPEPTESNAPPTVHNTGTSQTADDTAVPPGSSRPKPQFAAPVALGEVGVLGPYRLVKELGKGGMGAVYLAVDTRLDRKLALKVMLSEFAADPEAKGRFLREARAAAQVGHDNVVTVYEADERDGVPYIAMQFLQGYPLDEYLRAKGVPPLPHVIRIAREAALGLAAAHELGLVHRDVKPGNIWLEAPNGRVKLLDFGLAKPVGSDAELTRSGAVIGTPAYMSPEQARGAAVDHRTDLFSLGALLYRLCTGRSPFAGPNVMAVLLALGTEDPVPVRELNPHVPDELARLVHQLLAKNPFDRPQTATEVARRLRAILDALAPAGAPELLQTPPSPAGADISTSLPIPLDGVPARPPLVTPMQVTAQADTALDRLTPLADEVEEEPPRPSGPPRPPRPAGEGLGVKVAAGAMVLLAAGAAYLLFGRGNENRDKDAKEPAPGAPTFTAPQDPPRKVAPRTEVDGWFALSSADPGAELSTAWTAEEPAGWTLRNGTLTGTGAGRLTTRQAFGEFELELECAVGATGAVTIQLRDAPAASGAAVVLSPADGVRLGDGGPARGAVRADGWNTTRVVAAGGRVQVTVNGVAVVDQAVALPRARGPIALKVAAPGAEFRNVRARERSADRAAAEWVFASGGTVTVADEAGETEAEVRSAAGLPAGAFRLTQAAVVLGAEPARGLAPLKGLERLAFVKLSGPLSPAVLTDLAALKGLTGVDLGGTGATAAQVEELRRALPRCAITGAKR